MSEINGNETKCNREEITNSIVFETDGDFKEEMLTELQFVVDCGELVSGQEWPTSSEFTQMKREVNIESEQQFGTEFNNTTFDDKESAPGKRSLIERIESLISENDRIVQSDTDPPPNKKININEIDNNTLERIESIINENDRIIQQTSETSFNIETTFPNNTDKSNIEFDNESKVSNELIMTVNDPNLEFKILEDSGQIAIKCDICSEYFNTCQELEIHLQTHTQVTQCQICFSLFIAVSESEICPKCHENTASSTVYVDENKQEKSGIIYETVIINDIKQENNSEIIIPDLSFQCLEPTGILNETEIINSNYVDEKVNDELSSTSTEIKESEFESVILNNINIEYSKSDSPQTVKEPIPCSSKEDVLERIDRIINKNTRIMHESKIPKSFPKQVTNNNTNKKDQILNRIEKIIEKNTNVLDSSKVQVKPTLTQVNCTECGLNFTTKELYDEHIRTAHTFTFPCLVCCKQFSSVTIFNEHLKNVHKICKACNESFKTHQEFTHHENCHKFGLIKFYQCQICYNDFKKLDGLMEHMDSIHSMQQPYPVKTVKKYLVNYVPFSTLDLLQCVYCDVKFTKNEQLEDHLNLQHGVENITKVV